MYDDIVKVDFPGSFVALPRLGVKPAGAGYAPGAQAPAVLLGMLKPMGLT